MNRLFSGLLIIFFCLVTNQLTAQLSERGTPLKVKQLKSSRGSVVEMPSFQQYFSNEEHEDQSENLLKSLTFAHSYEVDLSPSNSGEWFSAAENVDIAVWRLTIKSPGAFSLNIIFDEFEMPENSRLFVYSETEEYLLGAFTQSNNAASRKFAVAPVAGDVITLQYEVPGDLKSNMPFRITQINHDFVGILKSGLRRPLNKTAGTCNIDVNCDDWNGWQEEKKSVVRMIVNGVEVCTGVLVNNTAENQKPYVLSAAHCYDKWSYAETSVYTFNYESPFCKPLDGDPSQTLSGAVMKAQFDSVDFALVQLNTVPVPDYRPYYAGWNRSADAPSSTVSIHHPQGDVKKLANDKNPPVIASYGEAGTIDKAYIKNGFWWIKNWENGTTEAGSSGGPLFGDDKLLRGTLTGGEAKCGSSINDYFSRFALAWDYRKDSTKQLKYWLDPLKTNPEKLSGKQFYDGEDLCGSINNLSDIDTYALVPARNGNAFAGYWGGSNNLGITEVTEKFVTDKNLHLKGISLGVAKIKNAVKNQNSEITIKIYNGSSAPEQLIYSQVVKTSAFAGDAMNYIQFSEVVKPGSTFFAGFELSNVQSPDSFAILQSLKTAGLTNTCFLKKNNQWSSFTNLNTEGKPMTNIIELVACNINSLSTDTPLVEETFEMIVYPNPVQSTFIVEVGQDISEQQLTIFNLAGQQTRFEVNRISEKKLEVNLKGNVPGIYFVRYDNKNENITQKISFVPW